jgi:hypothetical protein
MITEVPTITELDTHTIKTWEVSRDEKNEKKTESEDRKVNVGITTHEVQKIAETIPSYCFNKFGAEATKRLLGGTGDMDLVISDKGEVINPVTKTIIFTNYVKVPRIEMALNSSWGNSINNFENSFLSVKVTPNVSIPERSQGNFDEEDVEYGYNIAEIKKDPDEKRSNFKAGDSQGRYYSGVRAIEESLKENSMNPEDVLDSNDSMFSSKLQSPEINPFQGLMPETSSISSYYLEPIIPLMNKTIEGFNLENGKHIHNSINPNAIATSLMYKKIAKSEGLFERKTIVNNLTPIVLSPTLSIFRGIDNHFLVVAKTRKGLEATFLRGNILLPNEMDRWLENNN